MVNGIVYTTAGSRRAVVALDAATGELLWVHGEHEGARGRAAPRQLSGRGLAYWTDGRRRAHPLRHARLSPDRAQREDRRARRKLRQQRRGRSEGRRRSGRSISISRRNRPALDARRRASDVVIVGAAHRSGGVPKSNNNVKGYVRGFDVRTGKRLVDFPHHPAARRIRHTTPG